VGWRGGPAPVGSHTTVRESSLSLPASELPHTVEEALFTLAGDQAVPTELSGGPSSPDALHGGPVSAPVVRALEHYGPGRALQPVRLTLELLRPVPFAPLTLRPRGPSQGGDTVSNPVGTARCTARATNHDCLRVSIALRLATPQMSALRGRQKRTFLVRKIGDLELNHR